MALKIANKIYLSWDDIDQAVEEICLQILKSGKQIKSISGVARGGYIPAVMISHRLNIPYATRLTPTTLLVDDISDTGTTLNKSIAVHTATLHYKPTSKHKPTFFAKEVGPEWIVYPWERKDSKEIQDYLGKQEKVSYIK